MRTLIENLCGKLKDWGIDPITLAKAIGIFITLVIIVALMFLFPKMYIGLLIILICVMLIALIYSMLE